MKTPSSIIILGLVAVSGVAAQNVVCDDTAAAFTCGEAQITGNDCQSECICLEGGGSRCAGFDDINGNNCPADELQRVCFRDGNGPDCECR
ncbi:hypothetical protein V8F20_006435 [Naviculisporaceae sp. PSN 640]